MNYQIATPNRKNRHALLFMKYVGILTFRKDIRAFSVGLGNNKGKQYEQRRQKPRRNWRLADSGSYWNNSIADTLNIKLLHTSLTLL